MMETSASKQQTGLDQSSTAAKSAVSNHTARAHEHTPKSQQINKSHQEQHPTPSSTSVIATSPVNIKAEPPDEITVSITSILLLDMHIEKPADDSQ